MIYGLPGTNVHIFKQATVDPDLVQRLTASYDDFALEADRRKIGAPQQDMVFVFNRVREGHMQTDGRKSVGGRSVTFREFMKSKLPEEQRRRLDRMFPNYAATAVPELVGAQRDHTHHLTDAFWAQPANTGAREFLQRARIDLLNHLQPPNEQGLVASGDALVKQIQLFWDMAIHPQEEVASLQDGIDKRHCQQAMRTCVQSLRARDDTTGDEDPSKQQNSRPGAFLSQKALKCLDAHIRSEATGYYGSARAAIRACQESRAALLAEVERESTARVRRELFTQLIQRGWTISKRPDLRQSVRMLPGTDGKTIFFDSTTKAHEPIMLPDAPYVNVGTSEQRCELRYEVQPADFADGNSSPEYPIQVPIRLSQASIRQMVLAEMQSAGISAHVTEISSVPYQDFRVLATLGSRPMPCTEDTAGLLVLEQSAATGSGFLHLTFTCPSLAKRQEFLRRLPNMHLRIHALVEDDVHAHSTKMVVAVEGDLRAVLDDTLKRAPQLPNRPAQHALSLQEAAKLLVQVQQRLHAHQTIDPLVSEKYLASFQSLGEMVKTLLGLDKPISLQRSEILQMTQRHHKYLSVLDVERIERVATNLRQQYQRMDSSDIGEATSSAHAEGDSDEFGFLYEGVHAGAKGASQSQSHSSFESREAHMRQQAAKAGYHLVWEGDQFSGHYRVTSVDVYVLSNSVSEQRFRHEVVTSVLHRNDRVTLFEIDFADFLRQCREKTPTPCLQSTFVGQLWNDNCVRRDDCVDNGPCHPNRVCVLTDEATICQSCNVPWLVDSGATGCRDVCTQEPSICPGANQVCVHGDVQPKCACTTGFIRRDGSADCVPIDPCTGVSCQPDQAPQQTSDATCECRPRCTPPMVWNGLACEIQCPDTQVTDRNRGRCWDVLQGWDESCRSCLMPPYITDHSGVKVVLQRELSRSGACDGSCCALTHVLRQWRQVVVHKRCGYYGGWDDLTMNVCHGDTFSPSGCPENNPGFEQALIAADWQIRAFIAQLN